MRVYGKILLISLMAVIISCSSQDSRFSAADADLPSSSSQVNTEKSSDINALQEVEAVPEGEPSEPSLIDEEAIYKLSLAEEYYAFGVASNMKKSWGEAEYNFEKAIEILSTLEIADEGDTTALATEYRRLMNEITADYKLTLFNLNVLSDDASPYALDEKFQLLDSLSGFARDTIVTSDPGKDSVMYDMPIVLNDRVKKWIIYFQTSARKNFERYLARSGLYIPIMEKIIAEEGVPHDLVYLPLIESGFSDRAYSYAHAAGFWQFMSYTAKQWGLQRNWWYDERYDFEKSTRAAARYLKFLHGMFDDWRLALTAYNGGPGNVNKMIRRNKGKTYWDWKIRNRQMRNFVPKYMAAAIIAKEPERYGFEPIRMESLQWEVVSIDRAVYLKDIAASTGVSVRKIKELNPAIRREYTPPDTKSFKLRIPPGKSQMFLASFDDMKSPKETSWVHHKISRGETVSSIARKYGVSQSAIIQANSMRRPYRIYQGKTLMVPVPLDRSAYANSSRSYEMTGEHYIVRPGDNLWSIARAFGTTTEAIRRQNNIPRSNLIHVGQRLSVPGHSSSTASAAVVIDNYFWHSVGQGQSLSFLAKKYGTTINTLCSINGISKHSTLRIGQKLKIPGNSYSSVRPAATANTSSVIHTVRRGQNLSFIAKKYNTTINDICYLNGINKWSTLKIGQKLKIPSDGYSGSSTAAINRSDNYVIHKVRRGQNLTYIANKYKTTVDKICHINGISKWGTLKIGQEIKVPFYQTKSMGANEVVYYTVRRGDTLWDIAKSFATSTNEIIRLNDNINPHRLRVGQKLKIRVN